MEYEWDENKRQDNAEKHGIDFTAIQTFDWGRAIIRRSDLNEEFRQHAVAYIGDTLHSTIYTLRDSRKRIISLRVASRREREEYEQARRDCP